jgi:hypothetical protein
MGVPRPDALAYAIRWFFFLDRDAISRRGHFDAAFINEAVRSTGTPDFVHGATQIGWLVRDDHGFYAPKNFAKYSAKDAKSRERMRRFRQRNRDVTETSQVTPDQTRPEQTGPDQTR